MVDTSWQKVGKWYSKTQKDSGDYYHEHLVIPGVKKLLNLKTDSNLVDIGCGDGVLGRNIDRNIKYTGLDNASSLIHIARTKNKSPYHKYIFADATKDLSLNENKFTHAVIVLSLQNMENPQKAILNASKLSDEKGILVIVLNHPCYRIPRQSGWGIDETNKQHYRKVYKYLSPMKIPITMHPGQDVSPVTWSFHRPLEDYITMINEAGFMISDICEWSSDKESIGRASKMENRARAEIPLFMAIKALKFANS